MVELRRHYPADARLISDMRDFVRDACRPVWQESADDQAVSQLQLAVSEVASNIMLHGLQGQPGEQIELIMRVEIERVSVTFLYPGCEFTPSAVATPDFSGRSESGYGLYLIQQSVDELHFSRDKSGLCKIHFVKNRK